MPGHEIKSTNCVTLKAFTFPCMFKKHQVEFHHRDERSFGLEMFNLSVESVTKGSLDRQLVGLVCVLITI